MLAKWEGKETWALPENLAKALDNDLAKEGCLEDPPLEQILRNYQPCVSNPKTPEHHKERVNQKNTVYHKSCPRLFILQLRTNIPFTTMTWIVFCFGKHAMERNASTLTQDLGWDDIEGHLLEQLLKPTHAENNLMNCGRSAGRRSPLCYDFKCRNFVLFILGWAFTKKNTYNCVTHCFWGRSFTSSRTQTGADVPGRVVSLGTGLGNGCWNKC